MKTVIPILLVLLLGASRILLSDTPNKQLVGHKITEEQASKYKAIFIGEFVSLGDGPNPDALGEGYYNNAKVKVAESYKGSLSGTLMADSSVLEMIEPESRPQLTTKYLFFAHSGSPGYLQVKKLLPATEQNIIRIKVLIAPVSSQ